MDRADPPVGGRQLICGVSLQIRTRREGVHNLLTKYATINKFVLIHSRVRYRTSKTVKTPKELQDLFVENAIDVTPQILTDFNHRVIIKGYNHCLDLLLG